MRVGDLHATKILPLLSWVIGSKVSCQRQIVPGVSHLPGVTLPMALSLSVLGVFRCLLSQTIVYGSVRQTQVMVEECFSWMLEGLTTEVDGETRW